MNKLGWIVAALFWALATYWYHRFTVKDGENGVLWNQVSRFQEVLRDEQPGTLQPETQRLSRELLERDA
jgi:hypothetical protein